jgi:ribosome biogenesis GTPase
VTLNRRQRWRAEKIQAERIARANKASEKAESETNISGKEQKGRVVTRYGQRQLIESSDGKLFQCTSRRNIDLSVAGDKVVFQPTDNDKGIVTALLPRKNELKRQEKLIAANVDQLWLVVATEPKYQFDLIDRYLVVAENANLPIAIIINKIELVADLESLYEDFSIYKNLGYELHFISVKKQLNLDDLKQHLAEKTHIFLGQSGVGKSSLINELIPDLNIRVNEISQKSKLGKHTTTNTCIYKIASGGDLIDSPGIREFQLDNLDTKDILNGFREFTPLLGHCRFRNCQHINEPNCAIKEALESGGIHPYRYNSYLRLIESQITTPVRNCSNITQL